MADQNNKSFETDQTGPSHGKGTSARTARETDTPSGGGINSGAADSETAVDKAKDTAKTLLDQAKSTASDAYGSVAHRAASTVDEQKAGLTGGLTTVAETVRRVSGTITEGESQNQVTEKAAKYAQTAAQKLEDAAHYFERTDLRGIARDVEVFARQNPAIFLGTAFALGILAARFIKSGPSRSANGSTAATMSRN